MCRCVSPPPCAEPRNLALCAGGFGAGFGGGGGRSARWDADFDFNSYKRPKTKCAPPSADIFSSQPHAPPPLLLHDHRAWRACATLRRRCLASPQSRQDEEFYGFGDFFKDLDKELVRAAASLPTCDVTASAGTRGSHC